MALDNILAGNFIQANDIDAIAKASSGFDGVGSGLAVSEKSTGANMSVDVALGIGFINSTYYSTVSSTNLAIDASNVTKDRIDLVCLTTSNTVAVTKGTDYDPATEAIVPPTSPADKVLLAYILVEHGATTITNSDLTDGRQFIKSPIMYKYVISDSTVYNWNSDGDGKYDAILRQTYTFTPLSSTNFILGAEYSGRLEGAMGLHTFSNWTITDFGGSGVIYSFALESTSGDLDADENSGFYRSRTSEAARNTGGQSSYSIKFYTDDEDHNTRACQSDQNTITLYVLDLGLTGKGESI